MSGKADSRDKSSNSRVIEKLVVLNRYGIHARPAALLVKTSSSFQSDVTMEKGDMKVSGKSIMGLMTLEAGCGSEVRVVAEGVDAHKAIEALRSLFEQKFFED